MKAICSACVQGPGTGVRMSRTMPKSSEFSTRNNTSLYVKL